MKMAGAVRKGRFVPDNPAAWPIALREHEGHRVIVDVERQRSQRSTAANARYWACLVPLAQHVLGETRDVPLSKDQTHFVLVGAFAGCDETALGPVPVRTSTMTTDQFSVYCERVQAWLADNGIAVPERGQDEATA